MEKPQLFYKKISEPLNQIDKDAYYFSALNLEDEMFINKARIKEKVVAVRTQFLDLNFWLFRRITMPKSINY